MANHSVYLFIYGFYLFIFIPSHQFFPNVVERDQNVGRSVSIQLLPYLKPTSIPHALGSCLPCSHDLRPGQRRWTLDTSVIPLLPTRCPTQPCYLTAARKPGLPHPSKEEKGIESGRRETGGRRREGDCDRTFRYFFLPPDKGKFSHCLSLMHRYLSPESLVSSL